MRGKIEAEGNRLAFVFMEAQELATPFFEKYGLSAALQFSDPGQNLYRAFAIGRTTFLAMLKPSTVWRYVQAGILRGHGVSLSNTDMGQMPGAFLFNKGKIVKSYHHKTVSDRPDYCELAHT